MNNSEINKSDRVLEFPAKVKKLTSQECAKILRRALSSSVKYRTQTEISQVTGINLKTLGDYFTARHKPPQKKWKILRTVLFEEGASNITEKVINAKKSAERLKTVAFLLKDELEYFKESTPEIRNILKEKLPGHTAGYIASLLTALYDENQLEIFKNFAKE
jgi:hypothetical protein